MNPSGINKSKSVFTNYAKDGQPTKEERKRSDVKEAVVTEFVIKEGSWSPTIKAQIIDTIKKGYEVYGRNLEGQAQFLHFHLESYLGKRIQILIYGRQNNEGHCLWATSHRYIQVQHEDYIYAIWQVKLIEDSML